MSGIKSLRIRFSTCIQHFRNVALVRKNFKVLMFSLEHSEQLPLLSPLGRVHIYTSVTLSLAFAVERSNINSMYSYESS